MSKVYSANNEGFDFDSIDDAVSDLLDNDLDCEVGDIRSIWEGDFITNETGDFFVGGSKLLEDLLEAAAATYEDFPETSTAHQDQDQELVDTIKSAIDAWADKYNLHPTGGYVANVKEIKVKLLTVNGAWEVF